MNVDGFWILSSWFIRTACVEPEEEPSSEKGIHERVLLVAKNVLAELLY